MLIITHKMTMKEPSSLRGVNVTDDLLEIRDTANYSLDGLDYEVCLCDNPNDVRSIIIEKNKASNRARVLAGYCWRWEKAKKNDPSFHGIKSIEGLKKMYKEKPEEVLERADEEER